MLKIKQDLILKINKIDKKAVIRYSLIFIFGFLAPRGGYMDMPFSFLSILFIKCFNEVEDTLTFSLGSFISFGLLSLNDSFFMPYLLAVGVYALSFGWIGNRRLSNNILHIVFIVFKAVFVLFEVNAFLRVLLVGEIALITFLPYNIKIGASNLKNAKESVNIEDYMNNFLCILFFCLSFSFIGARYLFVDIALSFSISLYFSKHLRYDLSFISLIAAGVLLAMQGNFYIYFLSFVSIYFIASSLAKKQWWLMYVLSMFFVSIINISLVMIFGDFSLMLTVTFSLILHFLLHKFIPFKNILQNKDAIKSQKDYYKLMQNLNKLNKSLSFLGNSVVDIAKLNEKKNEETSLDYIVAEEVCKKCKNKTYCWQEKYSQTQDQFTKFANKVNQNKLAYFDEWFYSHCNKTNQLETSFKENARLLLTKRYINQSRKNNQKLLQRAFLAISQTVSDIEIQNRKNFDYDVKLTDEMNSFLKDLNLKANYCLVQKNPEKFSLSVAHEVSEKNIQRIKLKLEQLFKTAFKKTNVENNNDEYIYTFSSLEKFSFEVSYESKGLSKICGDEFTYFETEENIFMLLSDGMGTGVFAAAESKTAIAMIESLLKAGVGVLKAIEIVNLTLNLKSDGESGASMDILQINKYTAKATLTKAGAGESIILHNKGLQRLYKDTLPLGILRDTKTTQYEFMLNENDVVLLLSDGAKAENNVRSMYTLSCEKIVSNIMKTPSNDDRTVAAVKLYKKAS